MVATHQYSNNERKQNMKKETQVFTLLGGVFLGIGVIAFIIMVVMFFATQATIRNSDVVDAQITDITHRGDRYRTYVTYEYKGATYQDVQLNFHSSTMYKGKIIQLYVNRDNPEKVSVKTGFPFILFPAIFGFSFSAVGLPFILVARGKKKRKKYLLENGRLLHGVVEQIVLNHNIQANSRPLSNIVCIYTDPITNQSQRFVSEAISIDYDIAYKAGDSIDIYVDPNNYRKYYVDVDREGQMGM